MAPDDPLRGGTYPPFGIVTHDDHGSYVIIATWVFACISVLFVLVRVVLRTWTARRFGLDNGFIVAALCFAIAQSISASEAVRYGLGKRFDRLSKSRVLTYYRLIFVADLLAIFVFVLSKLSLIHLINRLTPSRRANAFFSYFASFTVVWGIAYVFSHSFQCGVHVPKRAYDNRCVDEAGLIFAHATINILTDALIVFTPALIVWRVQIPRQQKLLVAGLFFSRLCVCVTMSMRLGTVEEYLSGEDPTWNYLLPTLWNQVSVHLSVITACVPSIKPFFDSLQSSLVDSSIPRNYTPQNIFEMNPWKQSKKISAKSSRAPYSLRGMGLATTVHNEIEGGAAGDSASTKGLTDSVIHQQREVDVVIAEASTVSDDSRFP